MIFERDDILIPKVRKSDLMYNCTGLKYLGRVRLIGYVKEGSSLAILQILDEPTGDVYASQDTCITTMAKKDMNKTYHENDNIIADITYFSPAVSAIEFGPKRIDWRIKLIMIMGN